MAILSWLFDSPPYATSFWYLIPAVVFALVFVGSILVYAFSRSLFPGHSLNIRLARRYSGVGIALGAIGLIVVGARFADIAYLGTNALVILAGLAVVAFAVYLAYFLRTRYPAQLATYQAEQARLRFVKPIRTGGGAVRRRSKKTRR